MNPDYTLHCGDALTVLKTLPSASVHCCVTSPPYWGLRDYGVDGQLGLESSPDEYVGKMVKVFREVRRVLHDGGTVWLNVGDSYTGSGKGGNPDEGKQATNKGSQTIDVLYGKTGETARMAAVTNVSRRICSEIGMKPKDLCLIPWRLAIALQQDGWWVRSIICWAKKSCMPESVTDRPTNSWEPIFLLTKSSRYFFDAEAVKEPAEQSTNDRDKYNRIEYQKENRDGFVNHLNPASGAMRDCGGTRNQRNVWHLGPEPYSEAHFATFPTEIPRRAILAGTSARGCCPKCGEPWVRQTEKTMPTLRKVNGTGPHGEHGLLGGNRFDEAIQVRTVGWEPGCECEKDPMFRDDPIPCTVLDPFGGSGTTGMVALELGRKVVLVELNPEYVRLIQHRLNVTPGLRLA
jgi:DNA modification methylase